jgi:ferredoxin
LKVDALVQIRSAECLGCMECVSVCPAEGALDLAVALPLAPAPRARRNVPGWVIGAGALALFAVLVIGAKATGHWASPISPDEYRELIPHAAEFSHPGR